MRILVTGGAGFIGSNLVRLLLSRRHEVLNLDKLTYAIDASKIRNELGWQLKLDHQSGFRKTVAWHLDREDWWKAILSGEYRLERIGRA